jgi:nucleoside 2-deoxyribosyltransferase
MIAYQIYLAHPISGLSGPEVADYFDTIRTRIKRWDILSPMTGKDELRTELKYRSSDYRLPVATNHAIVERDRWMVENADAILCDLTGAEHVSIGCCMELAWAHAAGKHSVVVMERGNIHEHAFVHECADVRFETMNEAVAYLNTLVGVK